jgi:hypothetical protein
MAAPMSALAAGRALNQTPLRKARLLNPRSDKSEGTNPAVGYAVARRLGVEVDEEKAVALGLRWLNTPRRWKSRVEPSTYT